MAIGQCVAAKLLATYTVYIFPKLKTACKRTCCN